MSDASIDIVLKVSADDNAETTVVRTLESIRKAAESQGRKIGESVSGSMSRAMREERAIDKQVIADKVFSKAAQNNIITSASNIGSMTAKAQAQAYAATMPRLMQDYYENLNRQARIQQDRDIQQLNAKVAEEMRIKNIQQDRDIQQLNAKVAEENRIKKIQQDRDIQQLNAKVAEENRIKKIQQDRDIQQLNAKVAEENRIKKIQQDRDIQQLNAKVAEENRIKKIQQDRDIQQWKEAQKELSRTTFAGTGIKTPEAVKAQIASLKEAKTVWEQAGKGAEGYAGAMAKITAELNVLEYGNARARGALHQFSAKLASLTFEVTGAVYGLTALTALVTGPALFGMSYLKSIEDAKIGMVGTLITMGKFTEGADKFSVAMGVADQTVKGLEASAVKFGVPLDEIAQVFRAIVAPGLQAGMTLEQIGKSATIASVAVRALGLSANQVVQETRDLFSAGITAASSTLATSLGLRDSDIKKAKENARKGIKDFYTFMQEQLAGYEIVAANRAGTLTGAFDILKMKAQMLFADTGVFEGVKTAINDISSAIGDFDEKSNKLVIKPEIKNALEIYAKDIDRLVWLVGSLGKSLIWAASTFAPLIAGAGVGVVAFGGVALATMAWEKSSLALASAKSLLIATFASESTAVASNTAASVANTASNEANAVSNILIADSYRVRGASSATATAATEANTAATISNTAATEAGIAATTAASGAARTSILSSIGKMGLAGVVLGGVYMVMDHFTMFDGLLGKVEKRSKEAYDRISGLGASGAKLEMQQAKANLEKLQTTGRMWNGVYIPTGDREVGVSKEGTVYTQSEMTGMNPIARDALELRNANAMYQYETNRYELAKKKLEDIENPKVEFTSKTSLVAAQTAYQEFVKGSQAAHKQELEEKISYGSTLIKNEQTRIEKLQDIYDTADQTQKDRTEEQRAAFKSDTEDEIKAAKKRLAGLQSVQKEYEKNLAKPSADQKKVLQDEASIEKHRAENALKAQSIKLDTEYAKIQTNAEEGLYGVIEAEKLKNSAMEDSYTATKALLELSKDFFEKRKDSVTVQKISDDLAILEDKHRKDATVNQEKATTALRAFNAAKYDSNLATQRSINDMDDEVKALSMTSKELALYNVEKERQRKLDDMYTVNSQGAKVLKQQYQDGMAAIAEVNANAIANRKTQSIEEQASFTAGWQKAWTSYRDSATNAAQIASNFFGGSLQKIEDSLARFILTGKLSFGSFIDFIKTELAKLAAKAFVVSIIAELGGTGASAKAAESMGVSTALSIGNLALGIANLATNINKLPTTLASAWASISGASATAWTTLAESSVGARLGLSDTLTSLTGPNAEAFSVNQINDLGTSIGNGLATAGAGIIGSQIGNALANDRRIIQGVSLSDVGAVVGGIMGAGNPVSAFIGGVIGGALDAAFGMGAAERTGYGVSGTFAGTGFTGQTYQSYHQEGGWFRSDSNWTEYGALPTAFAKSLSDTFLVTKLQVSSLSDAIGGSTEAILNYTKNISFTPSENSTELANQITDIIGTITNELAQLVLGDYAVKFQKTGETFTETLQRVSKLFTTVNSILSDIGQRQFSASLASAGIANNLVNLFGDIDKFSSSVTSYYNNFFSTEEKSANTIASLTEVFSGLGISLPRSREGFRAIVDSLDLTSSSGQAAFAALMSVQQSFSDLIGTSAAFVDYAQNIKDAKAALQAAYESEKSTIELNIKTIEDALKQRYADEVSAVEAARSKVKELYDSEKSAIESNIKTIEDALKQRYADEVSAVEAARTKVKELYDSEKSAIESNVKTIEDALKQRYADEVSAVEAARTKVKELYESEKSAIESNVKTIEDALKQRYADEVSAVEAARSKIKELYDSEKSAIESNINTIEDALKQRYADEVSAVEAARTKVKNAYTEEKTKLQDTVSALKAFSKGVSDFLKAINLGVLSSLDPFGKYSEARSQYAQTLALANAGNTEAQGNLVSAAQAFLEASQGYYASSQGYTDDLTSVKEALQGIATTSDIAVLSTEQAISNLDASVASIVGVSETVVALAEAIADYNAKEAARIALQAQLGDLVVEQTTSTADYITQLSAAKQSLVDLTAQVVGFVDTSATISTVAEAIADYNAKEAARIALQAQLGDLVVEQTTSTADYITQLSAAKQSLVDLTAQVVGFVDTSAAISTVAEAIADYNAKEAARIALQAQLGELVVEQTTSTADYIAQLTAAKQSLVDLTAQVVGFVDTSATISTVAEAIADYHAKEAERIALQTQLGDLVVEQTTSTADYITQLSAAKQSLVDLTAQVVGFVDTSATISTVAEAIADYNAKEAARIALQAQLGDLVVEQTNSTADYISQLSAAKQSLVDLTAQVSGLMEVTTPLTSVTQAVNAYNAALLAQENTARNAAERIAAAEALSSAQQAQTQGLAKIRSDVQSLLSTTSAYGARPIIGGGNLSDASFNISQEGLFSMQWGELYGDPTRFAALLSSEAYINARNALNSDVQLAIDLKAAVDAAQARLNNLPQFATGGYFGGGLRIVGENGPELEATGPARIFNASQTRQILQQPANDSEFKVAVNTIPVLQAGFKGVIEKLDKVEKRLVSMEDQQRKDNL